MTKLLEDYITLHNYFIKNEQPIQNMANFPITMAELATLLYCTERNAKIIISKMEAQQWLFFMSGRGRGHRSTITLLKTPDYLIKEAAEEHVLNGNLAGAYQLIKDYCQYPYVKDLFLKWLSNYFGYFLENERETLRLPLFRKINTLDPGDAVFGFDIHMIKQIYNTLVEYDEERNVFLPAIAHAWQCRNGGTEWTFHLRKRIMFHHGHELTATDVKYSFERLKNNRFNQSWLMESLESVQIHSKYKFTVKLHKPNYAFLLFLSHASASIVPVDFDIKTLPCGSGPFRVTKSEESICVLDAFDHYFQHRSILDRIEILVIPESDQTFSFTPLFNFLMVQTGETQKEQVSSWSEDEKITGISLFTLNLNKNGPLKDIYLRQALTYLPNRKDLSESLGSPRYHPASGMDLHDSKPAFDPNFNVDEGLKMLEKSSYMGEILNLFTYQRHEADAYWLQNIYCQHGIHIQVNIVPWKDILRTDLMESADMILFEAVLSEGPIRLLEYYLSEHSFIYCHLAPSVKSKIDSILSNGLAKNDHCILEKALQQIGEVIKKEYSAVFLNYKSVSTLSHPSLKSVKVNSQGWVDFQSIWFEPE